jgi:dTDP-4-dehydrorhamnose reductase
MRVLITGGSGMLGSALKRIGSDLGFNILPSSKEEFELKDVVTTFRCIEVSPLVTETKSVNKSRIDFYLSLERRRLINE